MKTKRKILTLLLAATCSLNVFAQKGMNGVGINIPVGVYEGFVYLGIGAKYQYNLSDYLRIEPSVEYIPIYSKKTVGNVNDYDHPVFKAFLNGHMYLLSPRPARPYILAGAGFSMWEYAMISQHQSESMTGQVGNTSYTSRTYTSECFTYNIGFGYDFRLSHSIALQIEAMAFSSATDNANDGYGYYDYRDCNHSGKFSFLGRVGFVYTF